MLRCLWLMKIDVGECDFEVKVILDFKVKVIFGVVMFMMF